MAVFKRLTDTRNSALLFSALVFIVYCLVPLAVYFLVEPNESMLRLAVIAAVAAVCVLIGFGLPLLDRQFRENASRLNVSERLFHIPVWAAFFVFVMITFATAPSIPFLSAVTGSLTAAELDAQRGAFLKLREGWQVALLYVSTLFTGTLLPYSMGRLFLIGAPGRFAAFGAFLAYAESFLQKALFIQVVTPIFYLVAQRKVWNYRAFLVLILGCGAILYINTILARGVQKPDEIAKIVEQRKGDVQALEKREKRGDRVGILLEKHIVPPKFFSADFRPTNALEHLAWRTVAVPLFTASDALLVHERRFGGEFLLGKTSTFLAIFHGEPRIPFEKIVFAHQWGENDAAASNSVYLTEAFVNFGWIGVVLFSFVIGQSFRVFHLSDDDAFKAMWPLFAYVVIQAGLIGAMLSNGYLLLLLLGLGVRLAPISCFDRTVEVKV